jgi:Asp-tRNA(Asn)/Glu-tRNA(Gln) amidotransferase A subunit family amidase
MAQGFAIDPRCAQALAETATLLGGLGHDIEFASPGCRGDRLLAVVTTLLCVALAEELPGLAALTGRSIGPETVERCHLELMRRGERVPAVELSRALALRGELGRMLGRFFGRYDVLLTPTLAAPPVKLGELDTDATDTDDYLQRLWRYAPFTPLEWTAEDWPIGMMFTSAYGTEDTLFGLAAPLEEARPWRGRHPPVSAWA